MPPRARDHRQGGGAGATQLPDDQLALGLQPDHEEEQRHQPVVDPVVQVLSDAEAPEPDGHVGAPQRAVGVRPRGVRPHQRDDGGDEELALDLQTDHKEEDGHQPVVDPVPQRLGEVELLSAQGELRGPDRVVGIAPG